MMREPRPRDEHRVHLKPGGAVPWRVPDDAKAESMTRMKKQTSWLIATGLLLGACTRTDETEPSGSPSDRDGPVRPLDSGDAEPAGTEKKSEDEPTAPVKHTTTSPTNEAPDTRAMGADRTMGADSPPVSEPSKSTTDAGTVPFDEPVVPTEVVANPQDEASYIYDQNELRTYELELGQADLDFLNADPAAEQYVPGALIFEGQRYEDVGVRYKGSVGAFRRCVGDGGGPIGMVSGPKTCPKLSMKVKFNFVDPEARFFGLKKLQFHAMNNDSSLMRERLGYWVFREMGAPAPRVVHARLMVNGKLEGLFALVEQVDGRFTRSRFTEGGEGNLYKEVWPMFEEEEPYLNALKTNEDEDPSVSTMVSFAGALAAAQGDELVDVLDRYLDREAILTYLAVDRAIEHWDGPTGFYCGLPPGQGSNPGPYGNHNYYWYEEAASARLWMIAWDLDLSMGSFRFGQTSSPWYEPVAEEACQCSTSDGFVARRPTACDKLFQGLAMLGDEFDARLAEVREGPMSPANANAVLDTWSAQISSAVEEQAQLPEHLSVSAWQSSLSTLRSSVGTLASGAP